MNTSKINRLWDYVRNEMRKEKPNHTNLARREMLFGLQVALSQYELAKKEKNQELKKFCADILETYEEHDINGHIVWKR